MPERGKVHWRYSEKGVLTVYQFKGVIANKWTKEK